MTSRLDNLTNSIVELGPKATEQVISLLLKRKIHESSAEKQASLSLSRTPGGKPLNVSINSKNTENALQETLFSENSKPVLS